MEAKYIGIRTPEGLTVKVERGGKQKKLSPQLEVVNHSPSGFECGYQGSGPAQLALAILVDVIGDKDTAVRLHQLFKRSVIASLPRDTDWVLSEGEVKTAVSQLERTQ